ncbi:MAG: hypothetical protein KF852_06290 [Saprospiraceae bacterium]|nr:hypothetical protein [Saprospiraceae bacterium]
MTLIDQIRELIAEGETERSLEELYKYVKENNADVIDTLVMLRNRMRGIQDEVIRGTMDSQTAALERAKVNDAILKILPQLTPEYMAQAGMWKQSAATAAAPARKAAPAAASGSKLKWLLMGGGAVLLLIVLIAVLSGGGGDDNTTADMDPTAEEALSVTLLERVTAAHGGYAVWLSQPDANGLYSTFVFDNDSSFTEYNADGEAFTTFSIQEVTSEYVLLYDEAREITMRIHETEAFFQNPGDPAWKKLRNGQWVTPE